MHGCFKEKEGREKGERVEERQGKGVRGGKRESVKERGRRGKRGKGIGG
jgi:hypothetical protein